MLETILRRLARPAVLAALVFTPQLVSAQVIDRVLVVVNDGVITETEYIDAMRRTIAELRSRGTEVPTRRVLEEQVMEQLILERIQLQMADRLGITVSEAQVDRMISEIARRQGISAERLVREAERVGLERARYRDEIRKQLRIQRLVDREVRRRVIVSESEIDERVAIMSRADSDDDVEYEVAHISLLLEDAEDAAERQRVLELADDIVARLEAGEDFSSLARRHSDSPTGAEGGYLGWRPADNLPDLFRDAVRELEVGAVSGVLDSPGGVHIVKLLDRRGDGGEMIEQWRVRHILIPIENDGDIDDAREAADRLRERIEQGEDFGELARVHSSDSATRVKGGDLGWVSPGDTVPAFEETIRNLEIGQLSEPVETGFGVHLLEVMDRRMHDAGDSRLRVRARQAIQEEKGRESYEQWLRRIRDEAFVKFRVKPG